MTHVSNLYICVHWGSALIKSPYMKVVLHIVFVIGGCLWNDSHMVLLKMPLNVKILSLLEGCGCFLVLITKTSNLKMVGSPFPMASLGCFPVW